MSVRSSRALRRVLLTTAGVAVALAATFASGTPSLAADGAPAETAESVDYAPLPSGYSTWADVFAEQDRLDAVATRIMASRNEPGFGAIYVSPVNARVDLFWHGPVPSRVTAVIAAADRPVQVHPAPYSEADLVAQLHTLIARPNVVKVVPRFDASGLDVTVDSASVLAPQLQSLVTAPISVTLGGGVVEQTLSKLDDSPAFWGAGRIMNSAGGGCSAGFGVRTLQGASRMLTAAHCVSGVGANVRDGAGDGFGTIATWDKGRDYALVDASAAGQMWTGTYNSTSFRPVSGWGYAIAGNFVCRSSSFSNAVCGLEITETTAAVSNTTNGTPYTIFPVVHAVDFTHRLVASGNGDSGGSVYTNSGPFVTARGIISNAPATATIACTGVPTSSTRTCHWETYFVDIASVLEINGAQVMIG